MYDVQTILSAYDKQGTLVQWLKNLDKTLKESGLETVEVTEVENGVKLVFKFAGGTTIESPVIEKLKKLDLLADSVQLAYESINGITVEYNANITANDEGINGSINILLPLKGSESVVVDVSEDNTSIQIHLDADILNDISRSLKTPLANPPATELVAVNNAGAQIMLNIGEGLSIENGALKASGGSGGGANNGLPITTLTTALTEALTPLNETDTNLFKEFTINPYDNSKIRFLKVITADTTLIFEFSKLTENENGEMELVYVTKLPFILGAVNECHIVYSNDLTTILARLSFGVELHYTLISTNDFSDFYNKLLINYQFVEQLSVSVNISGTTNTLNFRPQRIFVEDNLIRVPYVGTQTPTTSSTIIEAGTLEITSTTCKFTSTSITITDSGNVVRGGLVELVSDISNFSGSIAYRAI